MSKKSSNASCLSVILFVIAIGVLQSLFTTYAAITIPIIIIGIIIAIVYSHNSKKAQERIAYLTMRAQILRRAYDISFKSQNILNTTKDVDTALSQYPVLISNLSILASATDEELSFCSLRSRSEMKDYLHELEDKKDTIINQVISRAYADMMAKASTLKTEKGRQNRIDAFRESVLSLNGLSYANRSYVDEICPVKSMNLTAFRNR